MSLGNKSLTGLNSSKNIVVAQPGWAELKPFSFGNIGQWCLFRGHVPLKWPSSSPTWAHGLLPSQIPQSTYNRSRKLHCGIGTLYDHCLDLEFDVSARRKCLMLLVTNIYRKVRHIPIPNVQATRNCGTCLPLAGDIYPSRTL